MKLRTLSPALLLAGSLATAQPVLAADEYNVSSGLTASGAPLGLHGVDPVGMIDGGSAVEGSASHTVVHDGVAYYFDSAETKTRFEAEPNAYLPQNGGFCTFGVSVGKKFDGDPQFTAIVGGKLYVFLNEEIFNLYLADEAGTIAKAAENWPNIREIATTDL